jgi:hypothetical protein
MFTGTQTNSGTIFTFLNGLVANDFANSTANDREQSICALVTSGLFGLTPKNHQIGTGITALGRENLDPSQFSKHPTNGDFSLLNALLEAMQINT